MSPSLSDDPGSAECSIFVLKKGGGNGAHLMLTATKFSFPRGGEGCWAPGEAVPCAPLSWGSLKNPSS